MCFYNDDYDWYAETYADSWARSEDSAHCYECGAPVAAGDRRRVIHMEESDGRCLECDEYEDCRCDKRTLGETFDCQICRPCGAILAAIKLRERRAKCPTHAQQPPFGELREAIQNDDGEYAALAIKLFPSLAAHPFFVKS